jgi:hypothetical protein
LLKHTEKPCTIILKTKIPKVLATGKHTFLFREGVWRLEGEYTDPEHHTCQVEGETAVSHIASRYLINSCIRIQADHPLEFHFKSEMPFDRQVEFSSWKCNLMFVGAVEGHLYVFHDHMVLQYKSANGEYSGMENLLRINDIFYQSSGVIFRAAEKFTSWKMDLIRVR